MRTRKFIVAGVTASTLLGGGVAAYAAGGPHGDGRGPDGHGPGGHGPGGHGPGGDGPGGDGPGGDGPSHEMAHGGPGFQHAESVSGSTTKGFTTTDTQHGTVTAYSASSVTVLSLDTFSKTYVITSGTKPTFPKRSGKTAVAVGDTVDISATLKGGTDTATRISDHGTPVAKATATPTATPSASATATA